MWVTFEYYCSCHKDNLMKKSIKSVKLSGKVPMSAVADCWEKSKKTKNFDELLLKFKENGVK